MTTQAKTEERLALLDTLNEVKRRMFEAENSFDKAAEAEDYDEQQDIQRYIENLENKYWEISRRLKELSGNASF